MYDSITAGLIPRDAQLVAGYVDGLYAWSADDWALFADIPHVRIAVFPTTDDGNCANVEAGDMTPENVVGWVELRRAAGVDPSVYCSAASWATVRAQFQAQGVAEPHYWIATWDSVQAIPPGAVAHQYDNGPNFDTSIVADYWPGVDPMTAPTPAPSPTDPAFAAAVRAVVDQYLAVDIQQGASAQALLQALLKRMQAASDALNLGK